MPTLLSADAIAPPMTGSNTQAWTDKVRGFCSQVWGRAQGREAVGRRAERAAARYLRRRGYRILARNVRTRLGEVDIVARHHDWLVIVEVRSRQVDSPVAPRQTLTRKKRRKLHILTEQLRKRYRLESMPVRVDLVEVLMDAHGKVSSCDVLEGLSLTDT